MNGDATRDVADGDILPLDAVRRIPATSKADSRVVSLFDHGSFAADQYESLRHVVEREAESTGLRILAITSPAPGDGKTLTSVNLATALARGAAAQVLIVDADVRRPSVLATLGLDDSGQKGLTGLAQDPSLALPDVIRHCPEYRLFVLSAGSSTSSPYDILSAPSVGRFFDEARRHFHFVIVDTPPAVGFPDFRLLERWADGSLLVVSEGVTARSMVEMALKVIDPKKARGIVLNRADVTGVERYYGGYYRQRPSRGLS